MVGEEHPSTSTIHQAPEHSYAPTAVLLVRILESIPPAWMRST
jgi:hypothetical protein